MDGKCINLMNISFIIINITQLPLSVHLTYIAFFSLKTYRVFKNKVNWNCLASNRFQNLSSLSYQSWPMKIEAIESIGRANFPIATQRNKLMLLETSERGRPRKIAEIMEKVMPNSFHCVKILDLTRWGDVVKSTTSINFCLV